MYILISKAIHAKQVQFVPSLPPYLYVLTCTHMHNKQTILCFLEWFFIQWFHILLGAPHCGMFSPSPEVMLTSLLLSFWSSLKTWLCRQAWGLQRTDELRRVFHCCYILLSIVLCFSSVFIFYYIY